jgi:hypothetical protein
MATFGDPRSHQINPRRHGETGFAVVLVVVADRGRGR